MAEESALRTELRDNWRGPGELIWVEAARGGSVGAPDVFVPLGTKRGYLPLELKWWNVVGGMVDFAARPSQRRFHRLAYDAGQRTAFMAMLSTGDIVLLPGSKIPRGEEFTVMAIEWFRFLPGIEKLREALIDEAFWRGKSR